MKLSEMNAHERQAFEIIKYAMSDMIGGCENTMEDYPEGSEEYEEAKAFLNSGHQNIEDFIYMMVMQDSDKANLKHLRFAGEKFIRERISKRLTKWGY